MMSSDPTATLRGAGNGSASETPGPRTQTERRWLVACLIAWLVLIVASVGVAGQTGFGWRVLSGPVNALAGAIGAVVIGAFVLQKWQRRIEVEQARDRRTEWLRRNLEFAFTAQNAMRDTLAELASVAYHPVASALSLDVIPDGYLRKDVTRLPAPPREIHDSPQDFYNLLAGITEFSEDAKALARMWALGPLATAERQIRKADEDFGVSIEIEIARLGGSQGPEPRFSEQQAASLVEAFDPARVRRLEVLAGRALAFTSDMTGTQDFEPNTLRKPAIDLVLATQSIAAATWEASNPSPQQIGDLASELTSQIGRVLSAISTLRDVIWENARGLLRETRAVGGVAEQSVVAHQLTALEDQLSEMQDEAWERWRRDHDH